MSNNSSRQKKWQPWTNQRTACLWVKTNGSRWSCSNKNYRRWRDSSRASSCPRMTGCPGKINPTSAACRASGARTWPTRTQFVKCSFVGCCALTCSLSSLPSSLRTTLATSKCPRVCRLSTRFSRHIARIHLWLSLSRMALIPTTKSDQSCRNLKSERTAKAK